MTNKEKFLNTNIGFHKEDLSLMRQVELQTIIEVLGVSPDWVKIALSKDSLENWEKWGFNLLKKPEFIAEVNGLLAALDKVDDDKFKQEQTKSKTKKKKIRVSDATFQQVYTGIMAQGWKVYTVEEAKKAGLKEYWTYSNSLTEIGKAAFNLLLAERKSIEEFDDDDKLKFVLSTCKTQYQEIPKSFLKYTQPAAPAVAIDLF
jgi:hypothetical protein